MSTLTFQIKLINRVKIPQLPEQYKKCQKQPLHLRTSIYDHLNVFSKTINIHEDHLAINYWRLELGSIANYLSPFHLAINPEYGDKLIGCFTTEEFGDFYIEIYQSHKWIKE